MAETKITGPSKFVWYELATPDGEASEAFYRGVIGWQASPQEGAKPDMPYTLLKVGETAVGGLLQMPAAFFSGTGKLGEGPRPAWVGYIGVNNVDDFTGKVKDAGGQIHMAPQDIPGVGRFSVVADPQKTPFVLFQPMSSDSQAPQFDAATPGTVGWHELHATDGAKAWEFYSGLFGWSKAETVDMGPSGIYQTFSTGEAPVGGMMTAMDQQRRPGWVFYVNVEDIDAAAGRIHQHGGKIVMGPQQVPGGSWIVQGIDPQGAVFAVVGPKKE